MVGMKCVTDLIHELREVVHVWEFSVKQRADGIYNSKVKQSEMWEGDMVLKQVVLPVRQEKL